jgi:predicted kinase
MDTTTTAATANAQLSVVTASATTANGLVAAAPATKAPAQGVVVQISDAARAAALEALETPAQTVIEARNNDRQAQRLLAKLALTKG